MENTHTAVEWLYRWFNDNQEATIEEGLSAFQQAREIEEHQLEYAYNKGVEDCKKVFEQMIENVTKNQ